MFYQHISYSNDETQIYSRAFITTFAGFWRAEHTLTFIERKAQHHRSEITASVWID